MWEATLKQRLEVQEAERVLTQQQCSIWISSGAIGQKNDNNPTFLYRPFGWGCPSKVTLGVMCSILSYVCVLFSEGYLFFSLFFLFLQMFGSCVHIHASNCVFRRIIPLEKPEDIADVFLEHRSETKTAFWQPPILMNNSFWPVVFSVHNPCK